MPTFTIKYSWAIQQAFELNFAYQVVTNTTFAEQNNYITSEQVNGIYKPTVIFPNGGEVIRAKEIEIRWYENYPPSSDGQTVYFEIFYAENFEQNSDPDYKMIATVPSGIGRYLWKIGSTIKNDKVRIAVRGVNSIGQRSRMSISANSFAIQKTNPISPVLMMPLPNSRYDEYIKFVFDESAIINTHSQKSKYYLYFSSEKANIPVSLIAQNIPLNTGPILWNTADLPSSDDYKIIVYLQDDDGNRSREVVVNNISIIHDKYFYIDTVPPDAYIQINDGDEFTRRTEANLKVYVYDDTTKTHAMQIIEVANPLIKGRPRSYARDVQWNLSNVDGEKTLRLQCQDFGGNRIKEILSNAKFRIFFDANRSKIVDLVPDLSSTTTSTTAFFFAVNNGSGEIYRYTNSRSFITRISEQITALAFFSGRLLIAAKTNDEKAKCYRWTGTVIESVFALDDDESTITSMTSYKGTLFFGTLNKAFYKLSANVLTKIREFPASVGKLYTDNNSLYILLQNNKTMYIYNGDTFTEVVV